MVEVAARVGLSEMFLSFPGFHQPQLLKKARGKNQTSADTVSSSSQEGIFLRKGTRFSQFPHKRKVQTGIGNKQMSNFSEVPRHLIQIYFLDNIKYVNRD